MKRLFLALLFLVILPLAALGAGDPPPEQDWVTAAPTVTPSATVG